MKNQKNFKKGFTLVEMMIVVAIIAILAGIAVPEYTKYVMKSKASEASRFMKQIADAEVTYYATHSRTYIKDVGPLGVEKNSTMFKYDIDVDIDSTTNIGKCFQIKATGLASDIKDKKIYLIYPDKSDANASGCLPANSTDDTHKEYWDGNLYFYEFYN